MFIFVRKEYILDKIYVSYYNFSFKMWWMYLKIQTAGHKQKKELKTVNWAGAEIELFLLDACTLLFLSMLQNIGNLFYF